MFDDSLNFWTVFNHQRYGYSAHSIATAHLMPKRDRVSLLAGMQLRDVLDEDAHTLAESQHKTNLQQFQPRSTLLSKIQQEHGLRNPDCAAPPAETDIY